MLTAEQIRDLLKLRPLPIEGGYFAETYRSAVVLDRRSLPSGYSGKRALSTAIYFMLSPNTFSAIHRLKGDEIYHFYLGDPVEMLILKPDGNGEIILLGQDILSGMGLQYVVPAGAWQGCRLVPGGAFALMGTTMSPGFDPADFDLGTAELSARYPGYASLIAILTRNAGERP